MPGNAVIDELVSRWDEARARGEETSIEELCRDHPELVEPVSQIIALRQADLSGTTTSGSPGPRRTRRHRPRAAPPRRFPVRSDWHDGLRPPEQAGEIGRLGPFRVMNLLGAGGMGSVYRAIDTQLGRSVALKVMQAPRADSERPGPGSSARPEPPRRCSTTMSSRSTSSARTTASSTWPCPCSTVRRSATGSSRVPRSRWRRSCGSGARPPRAWPLPTSSG